MNFLQPLLLKFTPLYLWVILVHGILVVNTAQAQNTGFGASGLYNFQTEGIGAGLRYSIHPNENMSFGPQLSYYFPFNKVHEVSLGLGIEYKYLRRDLFDFYALTHVGYNRWLNYEVSPMKGAKPNNYNLEGGLGLVMTTCLRPFVEYRYNLAFKETHLQMGIIYVFGCDQGSQIDKCPAYQ